MKKISGLLLILMLFAASGNLFAKVTITLTKPTISTGTPAFDAAFDTQMTTQIANFKTKLESSDLSKLGSQDKLVNGFGNAVAYSARSTSLDGYQGYDLFAFMYGLSISAQLPALSPSGANQIGDDIKTKKDTSAGVGIGSSFNLGLNITTLKDLVGLDALLSNRLYMNIKYFTYSEESGDWSFDSTTFGIGLNYQLVDNGGERFRLFKWSGVSVGSGFLYNSNKTIMKYEFDPYMSDIVYTDTAPTPNNYYMQISPDTKFGLDITSYIIPFDISTSARLLWLFNFTLGAGVDLTWGESKIIANGTSLVDAYRGTSPSSLTKITATAGAATIDGGTKGEPTLANFRLTGGLGICLGPLPIDLSATWYPITSGASVNLSTGIVW